MELITKIDRLFAKAEEVALALLLVGMILLAATQVLLRNIWNTAIDWADVSLQNATLLLGLLGAAIATSEGRHLTMDIFSRAISGRAKRVLRVVISLVCLGICVVLAQGGWATYESTFAQWQDTMPKGWSLAKNLRQELAEGNIPQWISLAMLACGYALIGFHFLLRLLRDVGALVSGREWETVRAGGLEGEAALDEMEARARGAAPEKKEERP
jgi:TRAP-type C4-dicarboxylate transport system permease small subunit